MTRKEHLEKCKNLLKNGIVGMSVGEDNVKYLVTDIFPLHPRWKEKCDGKEVKDVIVHRHKTYHNTCFALVLNDGSVVDISYIECINRTGLRKDIKAAVGKLIMGVDPEIINNWIKSFKDEELTIGVHLVNNSYLDVEMSNNLICYVQRSHSSVG